MNTEDRIHQEMGKIQIQVRIWSYKEPLMSEIIIKGTLMHTKSSKIWCLMYSQIRTEEVLTKEWFELFANYHIFFLFYTNLKKRNVFHIFDRHNFNLKEPIVTGLFKNACMSKFFKRFTLFSKVVFGPEIKIVGH